ncbi:hypothetical protein [Frigidibacter sp. ROC022]|uniref:hypothetical protein n=1 Tax=Frigidibacter sp. ROC022 TaxID=2971796 RepID=UPI00215A3980|nr:hypothetical protein [Frigidibacter sp. ROC022]MCR8724807.1 hypothetical protein [Frigidibacter sp. ROC022]
MQVLIVESDAELGSLWARHMERRGHRVLLTCDQDEAIAALMQDSFGVLLLDLVLGTGSAFAVADYASFRQPEARVIFVTDTAFFSDGSIFRHLQNAAAFLPSGTPPEDLVALVDHYGARGSVSPCRPDDG